VPIAVTIVGSQDLVLEDRLRSAGMRPTSVGTGALAALAHPTSTAPEVIVLDLRTEPGMPPILGPVKRQHPDTGLIIVASALDPALMLEAMRAGVTECVTDIERGDLEAAITRLVAQRASPVAGEVFVFIGAKGGVGTTTAAVNIGTVLSKIGSTLIIDLHLTGGDAALFLGADPHFSVMDALENTHRLDAAFFRGLVAHSKAGPDLLSSSDRMSMTTVDPPRVRALIDFAIHHYRYTVIDVPRADSAVLDSLESAAAIVVVANQELATVRAATRVATGLRVRYGKDKVSVVLSRYDRQAEIGIEDVQTAVNGPVKHVFPSDYRLAVEALNHGQPLVLEGKAALASAFQAYARELAGAKAAAVSGESTAKKAPGFLGRLTGRK
jgi:pilus assembly protein CpaE